MKKHPIVLGLPGLLCADEPSRIDELLQILRTEGIQGRRVNFSSVTREDKKIRCAFSLNRYLHDINLAFKEIEKDTSLDTQHIGIIASSISALFIAYYLTNVPQHLPLPRCYASISPLPGWDYFVTPRVREMLLTNEEGINLSSRHDKKRGIVRYIPLEGKGEIQQADALKMLREFDNNGCDILTIMGTQDTISDQRAMREYHIYLGGKKENLLAYEAEHDIPQENYREELLTFFKKNLLELEQRDISIFVK